MLAHGQQRSGWGTDSAADTGFGTSNIKGVGYWIGVGKSHGESISSSVPGVISGEGEGEGNGRERLLRKLKGALWGRGEISMESGAKHGDEDGIGGVVTPSHRTHGVVVASASRCVSFYASLDAIALPLTPCVDLLKEIRGEERPARRRELRTGTKSIVSGDWQLLCKGAYL